MIYLDHAATTAADSRVVEAMIPWFNRQFGNPSGIYEFATDSKEAIERVRQKIADSLGAESGEIYFTSGGTESDNWALTGIAEALSANGKHIITSKIEHHAVLHTCAYLESRGFRVTYLDVDEQGMISLEQLENAICPDTVLISIMFANNEIGTIQPVYEIGQIARKHHVLFHTDAVQAYLHLPIQVREMKIDLLSASSHKFSGPKGVGFLYVREGSSLLPLLYGGAQERRMRAGTENVPGIIGMGKAVELGMERMDEETRYIRRMRDHMMQRLLVEIPYVRINGSRKRRLVGNINVSFQFIEGESLLIMLDMEGICASAGSACASGDHKISHVLQEIGLPEEIARGTLRFTLGAENTMEEIDIVVDQLKVLVENLREFSDEYKQISQENT